ncbi:hypothetical protein Y032_0080g1311 [Ancylostoma ceylanicum]|uniref:ShKT domain-containing protein n=1 Tax=Ancylostoma ceylanicum TaxID=53326 RepID=A0A016TSF3_9BILA|nr:hypothetical protein Y032_0080g1311 [Ancylostoma ceylanicum]
MEPAPAKPPKRYITRTFATSSHFIPDLLQQVQCEDIYETLVCIKFKAFGRCYQRKYKPITREKCRKTCNFC